MPTDNDVASRIERWFPDHARPLSWRTTPRDPWTSLVAEFMLQQTQASRVEDRLARMLDRFPTPRAMADASVDEVLALWSGLGYYRRARLLHGAACRLASDHGGEVPDEVEVLRTLPGVGPYSAGSIASICFGRREPLVDGNVERVVSRLDGVDLEGSARTSHAWSRAKDLVEACSDPAILNEGLMELGATVCTPRSPRCGDCPLGEVCAARRDGTQEEIPRPKKRPRRKTLHCVTLLSTDGHRVALEKRPTEVLWSGMWQAPTIEGDRVLLDGEIEEAFGVADLLEVEAFTHITTHREVRFRVFRTAGRLDRRYVARTRLDDFALSSAQRRILGLAWGDTEPA